MSEQIDTSGPEIEWAADAKEWGNALNEASWAFVEACPEKSALLFNHCKSALRVAIIKYAECVAAKAQGPQP